MKQYLIIAICLVCSFLSERVVAQVSLERGVQVLSSDANQQIQDLINRSMKEWTSAGNTVKGYREFVSQNFVPADIKGRLQQSIYSYANLRFEPEAYSYVIYTIERYVCHFELRVLEDCTYPLIPNRYILADQGSFSF